MVRAPLHPLASANRHGPLQNTKEERRRMSRPQNTQSVTTTGNMLANLGIYTILDHEQVLRYCVFSGSEAGKKSLIGPWVEGPSLG